MENTVEFIGSYGGDRTHACSAWTSTNRDLTPEKIERIPKLLKDLATDGHNSPFEKSCLHFLVNTDIASHIHIIKHRIGVSVNAESARYKELKEDKFYLPQDWNDNWIKELEEYTAHGNKLYHKCLKELTPVLGRKRVKETARYFKTYNSQIQADVMFNFKSFVHFMKLRGTEHAQGEIREISNKMLEHVKNIEGNPFKYSIEAFNL
jgi:flavin-dependent thymidylate synthase